MKILYVSTEGTPFAKAGGLADVIGALPYAVAQKGHDTAIMMPYYKSIRDKWKYEVKYLTSTIVTVGWRKQYAGIFYLNHKGVTVYFIDNEFYFGTDKIYSYGDYEAERTAFFNRAVLESIRLLDVTFDILHLNDWQTAMISLLLKEQYINKKEYEGFYDNIKTVFTLHNLKYQGIYEPSVLPDLFSLSMDYMAIDKLEFFGRANFMKAGLVYSDKITTVSNTYKEEIRNPFFGENLDGVINMRSMDLYGIVNGLDELEYDPKSDKSIYVNFGIRDIEKKKDNKKNLQKQLDLDINENAPVVAMISRLVSQKGFDLVRRVFDDLMSFNIQFIVLGTGEEQYENFFEDAHTRYYGKVASIIRFDEQMARKIYAGSDMFLMPSLAEPCGISQLIAMRYGTIPIVRAVGGLRDTVTQYDPQKETGNGYLFQNYNAHEMAHTVYLACQTYKDQEKWLKLVKRAMKTDFSWDSAAIQYINVYERTIN
jgi:starch synthase